MCGGCKVRKKAVQIKHEKVVSIRYVEEVKTVNEQRGKEGAKEDSQTMRAGGSGFGSR